MFLESFAVCVFLFAIQGLYRNWGKKTFDAMPDHIDEAHEWNGYDDDDHWYTKWRKQIKGWFAFGPLSAYRWARFRNYPIVLVAIGDKYPWRFEEDKPEIRQKEDYYLPGRKFLFWLRSPLVYLTRVQYMKDWHVALEWPLFLHGHVGDWQFYIGLKRDGDRIYWLSLYFGRKWK